jgi:hypothetical protein
MKLTQDAGTTWPTEYNWEEQAARVLNGATGIVSLDAGKVRGLALAYKAAIDNEATIASIRVERANLLNTVGALAVENDELKRELAAFRAAAPRGFRVGDRVRANENAGFHQGAEGIIQFIEPSGGNKPKIWVLRDRSESPVFYLSSELTLLKAVEDDVVILD